MDFGNIVFTVFFVVGLGILGYRWYRYGGLAGAIFGAAVGRTIGAVSVTRSGGTSTVVKIHMLGPAGGHEQRVGMQLISKAPLGMSMVPIKLTAAQAQELGAFLESAAKEARQGEPSARPVN